MSYTSYILIFQLCIIFSSSSCFCQATFLREIQTLKEYLNATNSDVATDGPLFLNILENWKEESDKKIIQSQIISIYFKIFENLKGNQIIQKSMETIKEDLFVKFFNSSESKQKDFLDLLKIQANERKVQRKAISELHKVMHDLSPGSNAMRRRKRQKV
ncbi:interferon gamma [Orycteropus afer afer]|uniref:Interferon gamma n=1 Tax=Orycteropus afer afer TaxID=1230840 RepID=A0A8B7AYX0_ORYAF|nr:interferon gamma [Orycteropus afer afer]